MGIPGRVVLTEVLAVLWVCAVEHLAAVWGEGGGPEEPCLGGGIGHDGTCVPGKRVNMGEWGERVT